MKLGNLEMTQSVDHPDQVWVEKVDDDYGKRTIHIALLSTMNQIDVWDTETRETNIDLQKGIRKHITRF